MKVQLDIPDDLNKELLIYRIKKGFKNKQDAILDMVRKTLQK